jgi:hypothetical protein
LAAAAGQPSSLTHMSFYKNIKCFILYRVYSVQPSRTATTTKTLKISPYPFDAVIKQNLHKNI